jgi:uncharacterized protein
MEQELILRRLVEETGLKPHQINNTVELLSNDCTVPFIARYRKEVTDGLDEVQILTVKERHEYLKELIERKDTILKTIEGQGKLTEELRLKIIECWQKNELEDIYLPYKPKKRTRATIAKERGLEPLALAILNGTIRDANLAEVLSSYINSEKGVETTDDALDGAKDILAELFSENGETRKFIRQHIWQEGIIVSQAAKGKAGETSKYQDYYDYKEAVKNIPSHRIFAMKRGEAEEFLNLTIEADKERCQEHIIHGNLPAETPAPGPQIREILQEVAKDSFTRLIFPSIEKEIWTELKEKAEEGAIDVFKKNLRNLLLSAPASSKKILGVDPGFRTGCKIAVIDETGKLLDKATIYPTIGGDRKSLEALEQVALFIKKYRIDLIAIGNGTASRETDQFLRSSMKEGALPKIPCIIVNESGASVYSASPVAREEFPDLDVSERGAVSIGRRLQDPLAELVKIDPKAIGVGQYQHDVNQKNLQSSLDTVVESCVNFVGVDVNTASFSLLQHISGINRSLAKNIVTRRENDGPFRSRDELRSVRLFGEKAFEQAAGFLRIRSGSNPLDNSSVHPESYPIVEKMAGDLGLSRDQLIGRSDLKKLLKLENYVTDRIGLPTLTDIINELAKPGRDPRENFENSVFASDIMSIQDLKEGQVLKGKVTNVTNFGAFVDIGVHQDGLIHLSEMSNTFINDPHEACSVGDLVTVKVMSVDVARARIGLSIKALLDPLPPRKPATPAPKKQGTPTSYVENPRMGGLNLDQLKSVFKVTPQAPKKGEKNKR